MEQLIDILYEHATGPPSPAASIEEYLASPISPSLLEKIFLNLDTFTAEYNNRGKESLTRELVLSILQRDNSFLSNPTAIDRLTELSGNFLCEVCSHLHQWMLEESSLTEEALALASNILELKSAVDTELTSITAEKDLLATQVTPHVLNKINSQLDFTTCVLDKLLDLREKRERVMTLRQRDECTAAIELSNSYSEDLASLSLLIKVPLDELYRHAPPLDQMSCDQIKNSYFIELLTASNDGFNAVISTLSRGLFLMEISSVITTFHDYITKKVQESSSLDDILWILALLHRLMREQTLDVVNTSFFSAGSKVFEEVSKTMTRIKDSQSYINLNCATIIKNHLNNMTAITLIQRYIELLLKYYFSLSEGDLNASTTRVSMAIHTCEDGLTLGAYMKMRSLLVADLFVNPFDSHYELLESIDVPWIILSILRNDDFDCGSVLSELSQCSCSSKEIGAFATSTLLQHTKDDSRYSQKVLEFRSISNPQWHSSFHRRGEYYIQKSAATRSLVDCTVVIERVIDIITCDKLQKAILLADAAQQLIFRVLLFYIFREPRLPYTTTQYAIRTKFQNHAASTHQRLIDSLFIDSSRLGSSSDHILLGLLREYSQMISNILQHSKRYTSLTDATGMTLRESLAETVDELNAYYLLQNILHSMSERLYLETQMPAIHELDKQQSEAALTVEGSLPPQPSLNEQTIYDESDIFASESYNPSMLASMGHTAADSAMLSIRSLQSIYNEIESLIECIITNELNSTFNLIEIMYTTIKSAAGDYRKDAKVDRASKTVYSSKLIATLKNNFYNLRFGILATQSSVSTASSDSVLSIVTPPTGSINRQTYSLFNYQFYNAFVVHACHCFIASASSIPVYTAYGRTCLMYDYCSFHGFLNTVLPDFCLERVEIQKHFELVRAYIDLYFGNIDDIRATISANKFRVGPMLALIRTGLACRLTQAQIDSLVLELPSSLQQINPIV